MGDVGMTLEQLERAHELAYQQCTSHAAFCKECHASNGRGCEQFRDTLNEKFGLELDLRIARTPEHLKRPDPHANDWANEAKSAIEETMQALRAEGKPYKLQSFTRYPLSTHDGSSAPKHGYLVLCIAIADGEPLRRVFFHAKDGYHTLLEPGKEWTPNTTK